jgi:light-regulated signal transduction histidine kinase (bacteriophytochrome)
LLRAPIFASDDLALLDLFSEQVGAALDYGALLANLEQRVDDRTKQLQEAVDSLEQEIAARREAERAVQKLNQDLKHRALELKAANKELEAFAYSVSHDLRAPLRAIDGFSRVLMTKFASNLEGDALRYLGLVRENTQQMGELIDDLLAFSRLSRQSLNKQLVDPRELVRIALHDLLKDQADQAIEVKIGDLPQFVADPNLLRQVFVNLLSNAVKYSSKRDRPRIEVGCLERDGEHVYFVKDNGVGFDMQYADKLFGVFQRLHPADEFEGTGVGLAIIHRIITRHGGRVWAEAEVDKGAAFYFTLGTTPEPRQLIETSPAG